MQRQAIHSRTLKSVGYDEVRLELEIELRAGIIYRYTRVPKVEYENLISAYSSGVYYELSIKSNIKYGCVQLYPEERELRQ